MALHTTPATLFIVAFVGIIAILGVASFLSSGNIFSGEENEGAVVGSAGIGPCSVYIPCASGFAFDSSCNCNPIPSANVKCCPVCTSSFCPKYVCGAELPACTAMSLTTTTTPS